MNKKLPKVFANAYDKEFHNNECVYYSKETELDEDTTSVKEKKDGEKASNAPTKNIYQKLNEIFSSEKYVYKAEVNIKTKAGKIKTKIIGQNRTHIITMDDELIPITDIEDISFAE